MNEPHTLAKLASSTFNAINVDPLNVLSLSAAPPVSTPRAPPASTPRHQLPRRAGHKAGVAGIGCTRPYSLGYYKQRPPVKLIRLPVCLFATPATPAMLKASM